MTGNQGRDRVLIVDDEPAMLRVLERLLSSDGYSVVAADTGASAIAEVSRSRFDAVVSDIDMPGLDGIEVLRAVRAHDPDVSVVLVTGGPTVSTAVSALELGAVHYLSKPIDRETIARTVRHAVQVCRVARFRRQALGAEGAPLSHDPAELDAAFERAMATLFTVYQPIVATASRRPVGYEALVRTNERTFPHPGALIEAARSLGKLSTLGRAVRRSVAEVVDAAPAGLTFFVNLHPSDLLDDDLYDVDGAIGRHAPRVVLEITERASLDDVGDVHGRVARLRAMGFRIAVDDLGAGYAGLNSVAMLEPEYTKLDMSLVRDVHTHATKQKLVRSMTDVVHECGHTIIAEGVETADERAALVDLGVDLLQGYLLARPARPFPDVAW